MWRSKVRPTRTETVVRGSAAVVGDAADTSLWVLFGIQNIKCARDFSSEFQSLKKSGEGIRI